VHAIEAINIDKRETVVDRQASNVECSSTSSMQPAVIAVAKAAKAVVIRRIRSRRPAHNFNTARHFVHTAGGR
jgi:hypothetical protein